MDTLITNLENDIIQVKSTSYNTADVSPIILNETQKVRTSFMPCLVDNQKDATCCVSGKIVHEKKSISDSVFPSEKLSKKDVHIGDVLEINLTTSETKKLSDGLNALYKLHNDIGYVPSGNQTYTKVNTSLLNIIKQLGNITSIYSSEDIINCISMLSAAVLGKADIGTLSESIKVNPQLEKLSSFNDIVNIGKLKNSYDYLLSNQNNNIEDFWQTYLTNNQWIISQLFSCPTTIYKDKAYIGGKNIHNQNGQIVDYLYRNDITKNVGLVEIKTPQTQLLGSAYRNNVFSLSADLSGAINQLLNYKDTLQKEWANVSNGEDIMSFNPECLLIIGNTSELNSVHKKSNFELMRSNLSGLRIITFDELLAKIKNLINVLVL